MGKKDGKRQDKAKLEAKKARQAAKQNKATAKRTKKEIKEIGEEDIETIIAEFAAKDHARTVVTITPCGQPSPRSNFSMTALPNGEMLMFGGEFCDGEGTVVYNDLFRWNVEKNEWRQIESLNTPPPRCSHQAVFFKDKIYIFGGEYATLDQFHHYRDLWCLDLKTNAWTEIRAAGDSPSARSGHRMVVWRSYIVLFGGFYEALRELRWYNDLYLFSLSEERWTQVQYKTHAQVPRPRSGFQMCVNAQDDVVYVYGGYSKEKVPGQKKEGRVHEDMWALNLWPVLATAGSSSVGGRVTVDASKAAWQKISKNGHYPSPRCGAVMTLYKNKGLLFGGVFDDEGPQHTMTSTFFSDMFAFDMERRRWYQLGLKQPKKAGSSDRRRRPKGPAAGKTDQDDDDDEDNGEEDGSQGESEDEEDVEEEEENDPTAQGNFFGYIDETGNVVYIDLETEDSIVIPTGSETHGAAAGSADPDDPTSSAPSVSVDDVTVVVADLSVATSSADQAPEHESSVTASESVQSKTPKKTKDASAVEEDVKVASAVKDEKAGKSKKDAHSKVQQQPPESAAAGAADAGAEQLSFIAKYFLERNEPSPRINPCLMVRGNTLFIYGGVTELGDVEVTLDDCWSLDLNKRDSWKKLLGGTMHEMVWKGEDLDNETDGTRSETFSDSEDDDDDDDDGDDDEDDDDDSGDDDSDEEVDDEAAAKKKKKSGKEKASKSKGKARREGGMSGAGGLREEIEQLRSHLGVADENRTPLGGESLRQFYSRTAEYWASEVIRLWKEAQALGSTDNEVMSEKELKREGFRLAEERYNELLPVLARLAELEEQQQEEEGRQRGGGDRGGGGSRGKASGAGGSSKRR